MKNSLQLNRRSFLTASSAMALTSIGATPSFAEEKAKPASPPVVLFSKHLGWTNYTDLAEITADMGFDGIDLTVRPGGHVDPANVEDELPKATEAIRKAGLDVQMITTRISDPNHPHTESILKTASALKIPHYRIGSWKYELNRPILEQLKEHNRKLRELAAMNRHYNIKAGYHNHSGENYIGGPIWDILEMLRGIDPEWIGCNFDPGHAVSEGGSGAWFTNMRLISDKIIMSAIKDVLWIPDEKQGCKRVYKPIGGGMVDWQRVFGVYKSINFSGPLSIHIEYPIPGASKTEKQKKIIPCIQKDLDTLKKLLTETGLRT